MTGGITKLIEISGVLRGGISFRDGKEWGHFGPSSSSYFDFFTLTKFRHSLCMER